MKSCLLVLCLGLAAWPACARATDELSVTRLRCEYQVDPLGLEELRPRLSWELASPRRDTRQTACQIRVFAAPIGNEPPALLWDSGRQASDQSCQVVYAGPGLESARRYLWQVQVSDNHGRTSAWSEPASWEMGLLHPEEWKGRWIAGDFSETPFKPAPSPLLRREFRVGKPVASARIYVSALGLHELELNGRKVSEDCLRPGFTAYDFRVQYQVYDVTAMLRPGDNCLGAVLGDGWYRGKLGFVKQRNNYGSRVALLAQLAITYADGSRELVVTDDQWKAAQGPVRMADLYDGEDYDARLERAGWSQPGYDDSGWTRALPIPSPLIRMQASGPAVRRIEEIKPLRWFRTPAGETVLDLGQNMVGWLRFKVTAPAGHTVTLRHAEILDRNGNVHYGTLQGAKQTVRYTARGAGGAETHEPWFTFMGFRYVALEGWPGEPNLDDFSGIVVHTQLEPAGSFTCSDPLLNQLQSNIVWGQRGNFVDIPSDCPQRDERLGWTGDTQVFAPTACFNYDCASFYSKWLVDLALDQHDDGAVTWVVPNVVGHTVRRFFCGSAGWSDAAVIVPWVMYQSYGDVRILERQYASMRAWVEYVRRWTGEKCIWTGGQGEQFCDWISIVPTDKDLIQTAYYAHSADLLSRIARVLGRTEDERDYAALFGRIKSAFGREFVLPDGKLKSDTQTAYALALGFGLLPGNLHQQAADRLAVDVARTQHLTTGFLGTPLLCPTLSDNGHLAEAYLLLNQRTYPSWLYPITKGATTIWESWSSVKEDGTVGDSSLNHYAYGAVGNWMYENIGGIRPDPAHVGYKHFVIAPRPGGELTAAKSTHRSMYGEIRSEWTLRDGRMELLAVVPPNSTATITLPGAALHTVTEGGLPLASAPGLHSPRQNGRAVSAEVGSGRYTFSYPYAPEGASAPR